MVHRLARTLTVLTLVALPAAAQAAFPGSNGVIAYPHEAGGSSEQLFSVDPPNLNPTPITNDPGYDNLQVAWSPDGKRIAVTRLSTAPSSQVHIWVANSDGTAMRQITFASGGQSDPAWSPDGHRIVFASSGLNILNVDDPADTPHPVPGTSPNDGSPDWSPDGGLIAFIRNASPSQLAVIAPDGSGFGVLNSAPTSPTQLSDASPAWSPDGSRIYFSQGPTPVGCTDPPYQIYWLPRAGGSPVLVSRDPTLSEYYVAPSPDGTQIAFSRCDDPANDRRHIYVSNTDGTGAHAVTSGAADDYGPAWQPAAPRFASAPSVSGKAVNNQTLTAGAGSSPGGGSTTLQFERCDAKGANCAAIPGAVATRLRAAASTATYKLTSADLGHAIRVRQTQTNALGSTALQSAPTGAVVPSKAHCSNVFAGTARRDRIRGSRGSDRISGGRGNDRLFGLAGADCINGGPGNDVLNGGRGNDTLIGGAGNDRIIAGPGRNKINAGAGNDTINVRNHKRDKVNCGKGRRDRVVADRFDKLTGCEKVVRHR